MKKIFVILIAAVTLVILPQRRLEAQVYSSINFNTFYNELSPYGRWVNDMQYGQVWIADAPGFEPYYNDGHWVYTSYGWTWVSDYSWGWAPFHYGRWTYLSDWGWAWVPGYEWGPAWVSWCQNDGYFGWAPLSPGFGFNAGYNSIPYNYWRFAPQQYITAPSIRNHIIRPDRNRDNFRNVTIINNTQVNNNVTYVAGPNREAVERVTRQKIESRPVSFNGSDERTKVDRKEVRMYRPDLDTKKAAINKANDIKAVAPQNGQPVNRAVTTPVNHAQPTATAPAATKVQQAGEADDNRRIKPLPQGGDRTIRSDVQQKVDDLRRQRLENDNVQQQVQKEQSLKVAPQQQAQQQNEIKQQQLQRQQQQKQQDQQADLRQQQLQQQREMQRQNELKQQQQDQVRQQQLQQQKDEQRLQQQQRENELRQQQQDQLRQQQLQQKEEQRIQQQQKQNEVRQQQEQRQQQLQQQREQQRNMMQQQRQDEIRQQRMQQQPVRPVQQSPARPRKQFGN